jgi:dienelactone hydrolase
MNSNQMTSTSFSKCAVEVVIGLLLVVTPGPGYAQLRLEMRPVETVTLTAEQFLTGDKNGKAATLAGELRIPKPGSDKLPAVILIHGSGGISAQLERWAQEINSVGFATFMVDSFSGRGIVNTVTDQSQLANIAMMIDAYRALGTLAQHPRIDPNRISVMGFSKGAVAAVYSSNQRFQKMYGPPNAQFAAHIGVYTPCNVTYRGDDKLTGKPIRLFHGIADDWVPIEPCRRYVERLKRSGADVTLAEYPGAYHAYDLFFLKEPLKVPQAQTSRNCQLEEGDAGIILNNKTGKPFDYNDACMEKGTTVVYNEAATTATVKAVKEFLVTTFPPAPGAMTKN